MTPNPESPARRAAEAVCQRVLARQRFIVNAELLPELAEVIERVTGINECRRLLDQLTGECLRNLPQRSTVEEVRAFLGRE